MPCVLYEYSISYQRIMNVLFFPRELYRVLQKKEKEYFEETL